MKLNPVGKEKPTKERMRGKGKPSEEEIKEQYLEARAWSGNDFRSGEKDLLRIILQDASLLSALQLFLQEFGLNPVAHGGRLRIRSLGSLHSGAGGGTGGG
jgi:hypothetical protein